MDVNGKHLVRVHFLELFLCFSLENFDGVIADAIFCLSSSKETKVRFGYLQQNVIFPHELCNQN